MKKKRFQFSKILVLIILIISLIDMQIPFILAFLGRSEIAETLAITIVTEIIGVFAVYSIKAFLETKEEEKNKMEAQKINDGLIPVNIEEGAKG
ncbi:MAG: hypothetical protein KBT03_12830 [Bacteroidales bacterium]|nr:hypothetical protein [Candidatus Scybalousia scybalohippi]